MGNRHWNMDELEYLADNLGFRTHKQIGQKLGRTSDAVKIVATRRGYTYYDNFYSYTLLSKELGISRCALRKYVNRGLLKGHRAAWKSVYGHCPMMFTEKAVVAFLKNCNGLFANRAIPNLYFRNVYTLYHRGSRNEG